MRKEWLGVVGAVSVASLVVGCYSPKITSAAYSTKAFAEVALAEGATLKIVTNGGNPALVSAIKDTFKNSDSKFVVTDGAAKYWLFVSVLESDRTDTPAQAAASTTVEKRIVGFVEGKPCDFHEELVERRHKSFATARGVSVAVYEADSLTPVTYFEIPVYDGEIITEGVASVPPQQVADYLAAQVVRRLRDVTMTEDKGISVPVPQEASPAMVFAICNGAVARNKNAAGVLAAAKTAVPQPFEEFAKAVRSGAYKGEDVQRKLSDYYILGLGLELGCLDAKKLREIHDMQLGILELAETDSLAHCCPNALARLEYKLACLGAKL